MSLLRSRWGAQGPTHWLRAWHAHRDSFHGFSTFKIPRRRLDIGAHSGALLLRLKDLGFEELMDADLDSTRFDVPGAEFKCLELNQAFACHFGKRFQLVTSTDAIEHLDSPRNFLREVHTLLEDDGWLVISLPNVASWEERLRCLLDGELWQFGEPIIANKADLPDHKRTDGHDDARVGV